VDDPSQPVDKRPHSLPLSDLAVELIKEQLAEVRDEATQRDHRLARRIARASRGTSGEIAAAAGPAWVFPGSGLRGPITVFAVAKAIERSIPHFDLARFTSHDLRRTAATRMEEIGISPFIVAHVLGHVSVTKASITSKVYAKYGYDKEKREAVEKWDAHLRGIVGGGADVLPMLGRHQA
jgi:integrase